MSPIEISLDCAIQEASSSVPNKSGVDRQTGGTRRPRVKGKFLFAGDEKIWVRGVTYGPFRPDATGSAYHDREVVERDFAQIKANGMNAVRTYTVPPRWLLDIAHRNGLYVMIGLPWEQHVDFLDNRAGARSIEDRLRRGVYACAGHSAVLCYAIGNEIPSPIVRWIGRRCTERFIERLCRSARKEDPGALFTYVNYPSTEYLQLPFIDLVAFNVYLESQESLEAYLARLHNLAGDRPLLAAEIGLDSLRHGQHAQARALDWQVRAIFSAGCAGTFVFSWTDEWHRGGHDIEDWKFGLVSRNRQPKPALAAVRKAFAETRLSSDVDWPRISVVVCSYNGARTIRDCLEGLRKVRYPNFEVIVVDDGSTDSTAEIADEYGFVVIRTENRGLSSARNTGMEAATGEVVAYIDDDASPDSDWLTYLATTFMRTKHVAVGGPNIAPENDGFIAHCVDQSPGNPVHVLLSDGEAEHLPGCNLAIRKAALQAIGGFDPQFRTAGDDVDACWRLQQKGWTLGFSPAAMVWHHRRNSIRQFWKQQLNYGRAEAMLERKWPDKYNGAGHLTWVGRVYGNELQFTLGLRDRIYHGTWGSAPFQSLYQPAPSLLAALLTLPEWYLVNIALVALSGIGILWKPFLMALPMLGLSAGLPFIHVVIRVARLRCKTKPQRYFHRLKFRLVTAFVHMLQPLARLYGRLMWGLTPWRRSLTGFYPPWPSGFTLWSQRWQAAEERLQLLEATLRTERAVVLRGGAYDRWDLEVRGGFVGATRTQMVIEEHGAGQQYIRFRFWPRCSPIWVVFTTLFASLSAWAALDQAWSASALLATITVLMALLLVRDCAAATDALTRAARQLRDDNASACRSQGILERGEPA